MVMRWFLALALSLQVTLALASNPADDTPEQALKRLQQHYKNQDAYHMRSQRATAELIAQINMGAPDSPQRAAVKQLIEGSATAPDGSKTKIGASVTKPVNTSKVASTLVDRLKNAKDYAKKVGKASIPTFVGMAAFHALMEGIDYVMDEGGNVTKKPDSESDSDVVSPSDQYCFTTDGGGCRTQTALIKYVLSYNWPGWIYQSHTCPSGDDVYCVATISHSGAPTRETGVRVIKKSNPSYDPNYQQENTPVSDADLETALKNALESNNAALATAIAEAMKSAYTQDNSEGQPKTVNPLVADAQNDMQRAVDGALDTPTTTGGTAEKPEGYYKITDGDKTIEGYVKPSDTSSTGTSDSTTTTNPDGSTTTTGTTSQQWPGFCDWANIVCEFIDWVKKDEVLEEEEHEEIDDSIFSREFDISFEAAAACPPNPIWNFTFINQSWSKEIDITMICDFFKYLGYALVFAANMTALWIVYSAVVVRDQA
ncbi:hypothetical protein D7V32_16455 [Acinetobacter tianfuensis]|uniref:Uncharacterized protein n=2 Tax=Acinetobacter tianfuensis TaxID=2419603 RepID=A0A3A8EL78_9GAMM|nr:hypothetical protein D7V32_16455 [Acinetobacter tianfuensis]